MEFHNRKGKTKDRVMEFHVRKGKTKDRVMEIHNPKGKTNKIKLWNSITKRKKTR
jgi:hypothetical protein